MRIGRGQLLTSILTVDHDIDFLTLYQATRLAAPATGEALRKGSAEITMAEFAPAILNTGNGLVKLDVSADVPTAQIPILPYSKLTLTGKLLMADLATAIKNAAAGLVVLDASADVPLAQIPDTLTGKDADTVDGDHLTDIEGTMDTKIAAALATNVVKAVKHTVNYTDGSPVTIVTLPAGSMVLSAAVNVRTAFVGTSPTLDIGDAADPDGFMATARARPDITGWKQTGNYAYALYLQPSATRSGNHLYDAETAVLATIGGTGLSAGVADVYVIYILLG